MEKEKVIENIHPKAQSTLEYAVIIACIVAALIAMQIYIKRGISGRLRAIADDLGEQYAPQKTTSDITTTITSDVTTQVEKKKREGLVDGKEIWDTITTETTNSEVVSRTGSETVQPLEKNLFN